MTDGPDDLDADVDDDGAGDEGDAPAGGLAFPDLPGLEMGGLLDGLQKMQEAQSAIFEGQSGGGAVRIRATGSMEFRSVEIAPDAVDPDDVEMLQDLVLAALHDLSESVLDAQRGALGPLGGIDFGNLFGPTE